jgi:TatD DNase family protein
LFVDSHCHLDFPEFAPELDAVIARARAAGVARMVTISTRLSTFAQVRAIAESFPEVSCTVGVHPHEAAKEGAEAMPERLVALAQHPKVVGIGETGLDFYYEHSPREAQENSFRAHIAAARETGLPLIVHTRDAEAATMRILQEEMAKGPFSGLIHCFTATGEFADLALELGLHLSFSGIITFKKAETLRAIAARAPLERLLIETDAPYLAPVPHRGKRNEPAFVAHTAAAIAELRAMSPEELGAVTTANFHRLFTRVRAP